MRAKIKQAQVEIAEKNKDPDLLEAPFTIQCNDYFHKISDEVKEQYGVLDSERIYYQWTEWLKKEVRKREIKKKAGLDDE